MTKICIMAQQRVKDNTDQYIALLELRNTPLQSHGKSPVQLLFNRCTRTLLPSTQAALKPTRPHKIATKRATQNKTVKHHYDKTAKDMRPLNQGEEVWMYPIDGGRSLKKATVTGRVDDRSYNVQDHDGNHSYRCNRVHLRPGVPSGATEEPGPADTVPDPTPEAPVLVAESRSMRDRRPPAWMRDFVTKCLYLVYLADNCVSISAQNERLKKTDYAFLLSYII